MEKKKVNSKRVLIFMILFFLVNIASFIYKNKSSLYLSRGITGNSIVRVFSSGFREMSFVSRVFLIFQWTLLFLALIIAVFKNRRIKKIEKGLIGVELKKDKQKNRTDLDVLYDILKQRKEIKLSVIAKTFKINKDIAMEWAKILESGNLAVIDYPGFGELTIRIKKEYKENNKKEKRERENLNKEDEKTVKNKKRRGFFGFLKLKEKPRIDLIKPKKKKSIKSKAAKNKQKRKEVNKR